MTYADRRFKWGCRGERLGRLPFRNGATRQSHGKNDKPIAHFEENSCG